MQSDGRDINRIKVVDDTGRVRVYLDDPQQQRQRPRPRPPTRGDDD
jgi:RPA family protein